MTETRYHHRLYGIAAEYGLSRSQLNAICQVVAGAPLNRTTEEQARFALTALVSKGADAARAWAQELEGSL